MRRAQELKEMVRKLYGPYLLLRLPTILVDKILMTKRGTLKCIPCIQNWAGVHIHTPENETANIGHNQDHMVCTGVLPEGG